MTVWSCLILVNNTKLTPSALNSTGEGRERRGLQEVVPEERLGGAATIRDGQPTQTVQGRLRSHL